MHRHRTQLKTTLFFLLLALPMVFVSAEEAEEKEFETLPKQLSSEESESEKSKDGNNCVMVCERYGKDCVINPRTGTKKCRRTCKEMGQECF